MKAELIKTPTEITDESIKAYLAEVSSVVRQKQPRDNDKLFERLLKESYGGKPSRVFEFVPCRIKLKDCDLQFILNGQLFGFTKIDEDGEFSYYTTARELLNWVWSWEEVLEVIDFTHYRAVRITAPYMCYGQISTHTQITSVSHSARYTESDLGYWMPEEAKEGYSQEEWNMLVTTVAPSLLQIIMREDFGIKRREIYARGSDMLQYRTASLGAYTNNPNAWQHFFNQRLYDLHTQAETRLLAELIKQEIGYDIRT